MPPVQINLYEAKLARPPLPYLALRSTLSSLSHSTTAHSAILQIDVFINLISSFIDHDPQTPAFKSVNLPPSRRLVSPSAVARPRAGEPDLLIRVVVSKI